MYKVERYKFTSQTTDNFTKDKIYYLRDSKDGFKRLLTGDNFELEISSGKMSLNSNSNLMYLENNFSFIGNEMFNSYKDFKSKTRRGANWLY